MAIAMTSWLLAIPLLGLATGMRSMTPMAVLCWFAWLGYLPVQGTWAFWTAKVVSVAIFTVLALGEYIGDKLPNTPNRTAPGPLMARLVFGGLAGAIAATSMKGPAIEGAVLGLVGALLGSFAGYVLRRDITRKFKGPAWMVGVVGDAVAILCSVFAMHVITN